VAVLAAEEAPAELAAAAAEEAPAEVAEVAAEEAHHDTAAVAAEAPDTAAAKEEAPDTAAAVEEAHDTAAAVEEAPDTAAAVEEAYSNILSGSSMRSLRSSYVSFGVALNFFLTTVFLLPISFFLVAALVLATDLLGLAFSSSPALSSSSPETSSSSTKISSSLSEEIGESWSSLMMTVSTSPLSPPRRETLALERFEGIVGETG
jgi:hypothetical protein